MQRRHLLALVLVALVACGGSSGDGDGGDGGGSGDGGGGGGDGGGPDAAPPLPVCVPTCGTAADCATGPAGSIIDADNYACDGGKCRWTGCNSTAECTAANMSQAWACRDVGGLMTCVRTCSTPADCASPSAPYDADNYACVAGACEWRGCNTTAECMTIDPDWVCE